jgi:hypothetical protein
MMCIIKLFDHLLDKMYLHSVQTSHIILICGIKQNSKSKLCILQNVL